MWSPDRLAKASPSAPNPARGGRSRHSPNRPNGRICGSESANVGARTIQRPDLHHGGGPLFAESE
eukprot:14891355-Alexandrium_andersonii.AAC.1